MYARSHQSKEICGKEERVPILWKRNGRHQYLSSHKRSLPRRWGKPLTEAHAYQVKSRRFHRFSKSNLNVRGIAKNSWASALFFATWKCHRQFVFPTLFPRNASSQKICVISSTHYHAIFTSCTDVISTVEPRYSAPADKAQPSMRHDIFSLIRNFVVFSLLAKRQYTFYQLSKSFIEKKKKHSNIK